MKNGVSVVVCCYNSEKRLPETLEHLGAQKADDIPWEIIIVDNASKDKTAEVAASLLKEHCKDIAHKVVHEPEPGLSFARTKGVEEAQYEIILFVDDDNWLCDTYIQTVYEGFEHNPEIGIIGGFGEPVFEVEPPAWFAKFESNFATGEQADTGKLGTAQSELIYGAGMAIRKQIHEKLKQVDFVSILTDRKGDSLVSGGDNELCIAARMAGYEIWYNKQLKFKHYMAAGRLTWDYLKKLYEGFGRSKVYLGVYKYCLKNDEPPKSKGKHAYWEDRLSFVQSDYKSQKLRYRLKNFIRKQEGDEEYLRLLALKAQRDELRRIGAEYEEKFKQVLELKRKLQPQSVQ